MKIHTLVLGNMGNCCYILENDGKAVVIDPSWDMQAIKQELNGLELKSAFFTHGHFDHVEGADALLKEHNIGAYLDERDKPMVPNKEVVLYRAPKTFEAAGLIIEVIHTPGHSEGSVCLKVGEDLFTGDTLFPGTCGRTDFPYSDPAKMRDSLYRLSQLPDNTRIHSGHAFGSSTIGKEKETNSFMIKAMRDLGGKND